MEESFGKWTGTIRVTVFYGDMQYGLIKEQLEFHNVITTDAKNALAAALGGGDAKIYQMGWGTSTTAENAGQHALVAESGRKQITNQSASGTGQYTTNCYLSPNDANITIEELGWFTASNVMIARVLYHHVKTNSESLLIQRVDTLP